jgi:hypothetical protein
MDSWSYLVEDKFKALAVISSRFDEPTTQPIRSINRTKEHYFNRQHVSFSKEQVLMKMKLNWKVAIAVVVAVAAAFWGLNSVITRSYSGTELNFGVGRGPVTVTNPSDTALPVSLVSTTTGTFNVSSNASGVSGRSVTQGSGRSATQLYEFTLPTGKTEFTVTRGDNIKFVSSTETALKAVVKPHTSSDVTARVIVTIIVVLGSLFYISSTYDHMWISASRRQKARDHEAAQDAEREKFKSIFKRNSPSTDVAQK